MPAVNGVGKPCAGEPHARIDGRELETGHGSGHGGGEERPTGNRTVTAAPRLPPILVTAPAPDPPCVQQGGRSGYEFGVVDLRVRKARRRLPVEVRSG
jgi:hypothetical protein